MIWIKSSGICLLLQKYWSNLQAFWLTTEISYVCVSIAFLI